MTPEAVVIESMLSIVNKEGDDVPFTLNEQQRLLDDNLADRNLIPKPRQIGMSSYILARGLAKCLGKRNTRAVVISHETEATQRMLNKVHYMIENMRGPKPVVDHASKNEITFPKSNSMFYIGTAGSRKFGRGDTITYLHCSEIAFWENAKDLSAGLLQAVPMHGSEVYMESTGNGMGNYYHKMCMRAESGRSRYRMQFFPWHQVLEYCVQLTPEQESRVLGNLDPEFEEDVLVEVHGLTAGQIQWRRDKLEELDYDLDIFKQEYPMTLDECFKASGRSIFKKVFYIPTEKWGKIGPNINGLSGHPRPGLNYVVGADVAAGVGGDADASVAEVCELTTGEQVAEYVSNTLPPDDFGSVLSTLGNTYNEAFINVESNNHGIVTLSELRKIYPSSLIYRRPKMPSKDPVERITDYGWHSTVKSRPYAIGELRKALAHWMVIHSPFLKSQLDSFIETDTGKVEAEEGAHDDAVIALAMAAVIMDVARGKVANSEYIPQDSDPFSLDGIIEELRGKGNVVASIPKLHLERVK